MADISPEEDPLEVQAVLSDFPDEPAPVVSQPTFTERAEEEELPIAEPEVEDYDLPIQSEVEEDTHLQAGAIAGKKADKTDDQEREAHTESDSSSDGKNHATGSALYAPRTPASYSAESGESAVPFESISIDIPETVVVTPDKGKPYVQYTLSIRVDGAELARADTRYSALLEMHETIAEYLPKWAKLPKFPPKTWFFMNTTKPEKIDQRKKQLLKYFSSVLKLPYFLQCEVLHRTLGLDSTATEVIVQAGTTKIQEELYIEKEECDRAQEFHHDVDGNVIGPILSFNHPTLFQLKYNYSFRDGDTTIIGPDGNDWFKIQCTESGDDDDAEVFLCNLNDEPLMMLTEQRELYYNPKIYVYRLLSDKDNTDGSAPPGVKVCIVQQQPHTFTGNWYLVKPPPHKKEPSIIVDGKWEQRNNVGFLDSDKNILARLTKCPNPDNIGLLIEEGHDVMLLLSLFCCIEHLHTSAERAEREREASISSND